jgi:osmotically-inducible protein OsmY
MVLDEDAFGSRNAASPPAEWRDRLVVQTATHPLFRKRQLRIAGNQGSVVLTGTVASYYEKQSAQEFIRRCEGVRQIDNRIEVAYVDDQP